MIEVRVPMGDQRDNSLKERSVSQRSVWGMELTVIATVSLIGSKVRIQVQTTAGRRTAIVLGRERVHGHLGEGGKC